MSASRGAMGLVRSFLDHVDRPAIVAVLGLLCVSLVALYSVTHAPVPPESDPSIAIGHGVFWHQVLWIGLGLGAMVLGFALPFRVLEATAWIQYGLMLLLLVFVLTLPHRLGVTRWITLGPLTFQPSEPAKAVIIFVLARYFAGLRDDVNKLRNLVMPFLIILPPVVLILKQPDLGTGMVFFFILVPMLFWRGLSPLHLLLLTSPAINILMHLYFRTHGQEPIWVWLAFVVLVFGVTLWRRRWLFENLAMLGLNLGVRVLEPLVWNHMHDYQQKRIITFFAPDLDKLGTGYHVAQSKIAVGSGGFLGKGFMQGTQKELAFLPARHTDFIFSVIGEEFGYLGALVLLTLFAVLVARGISFASRARNPYARHAAFGIVAYLFFQVVQNIGMTVGLFPVAGIPLPLVSYGGSSLAMTLFLLGVLLGLGHRWREY